jgi:acyl-CoA thioester hydrolase
VTARAGASPEFRLAVVPAAGDIDELGHVSNLVWVRYVLDAARAHSRAVGLDHAAYLRIGGVFVVRRHEVDYLAPAFEGEPLTATTWIESWGAATSTRRTRIIHDTDARELCVATTTWAFVAIPSGRPRRIPAEVAQAFAASSWG